MPTRTLAALTSSCWTIVAACVSGAESTSSYTARDSAGVRIVEYPAAGPASAALILPDAPLYRTGDDPGEREWSFVARGALLPDGGAVVVDGVPEVDALGPDGSGLVPDRPDAVILIP